MTETTTAEVLAVFEDEDASLEDFERARKAAYSRRAEMAALERKTDELGAAWEKSRDSDKGDLALALGAARWMVGRCEEALEPLDALSGHLAAFLLGDCLRELGRTAEAVKVWRRIRTNDDDGFVAAVRIAQVACASGDLDTASAQLRDWRETHSDRAEWRCLRGQVLMRQGKHEEGLEELEKGCELDPESSGSWFQLGYWCELRGMDERAVESYEKCAALGACPRNALLNLGVLYEDLGRYRAAVECYERVFEADPQDARARMYLKDARTSLGQRYDEEGGFGEHAASLLSTPVSEFELSVRSRNCLAKMNVRNLGDLVRLSEEDLLGFKNFGETSLREIEEMLTARGLRFGMRLPEETRPAADVLMPPTQEQQDVLDRTVGDLEMSIRSRRALESMNITTVRELCRLSEAELLQCRNFGQTSLNEICRKLVELGLGLRDEGE